MGWKEFLKLSKWKIILLLILFIIASIPHFDDESKNLFLAACASFGFPFDYYDSGIGIDCFREPSYNFFKLIINLILIYLVSCLIIFIINKIKRSKR